MKFKWLREELENVGFTLVSVTFQEDGYEIRVKLMNDQENYNEADVLREEARKLDDINYRGFIQIETAICNKFCTFLLVPKSMDEMTEFIWKYVEKYGKRDCILVDILADAFCVLEKAIERIVTDVPGEKEEAQNNFDSFKCMIF